MRSRPPVVIEVSDVRALVPEQPEPEETGALPDDVLAAIAAYADRVVASAPPMDPEARGSVGALLRAGAVTCTGPAQDSAGFAGSAPAA